MLGLLTKDIEAHHLTDDVLRTHVRCGYEADVSALYQAIAEHVVGKLGTLNTLYTWISLASMSMVNTPRLFTCKRLVVTPMMLRHSQVTKRHIHCLKAAQNSHYFIADAALYTEESIRSLDEQQQKFITRVPMTIKSAKEALMNL